VLTALEKALADQNGDYIGCGLASNQIGIIERVCIVRHKEYQIDLVNPRITRFRGPIEKMEEGCLSFPGLFRMIWRFPSVIIEADNFKGQIHMNNRDVAQIIQHEINHLDAILLPDHKDLGRNDICPCGSGKKFKKCCM
jgi:peptide deformylase